MKAEYHNEVFHGDISVNFVWAGDTFSRQTLLNAEMRQKYRSEDEKPPRRERGDTYVILGTITGMIIGGVAGSFGNVLVFSLAIIGGGIVGTIIGNLIKKWRHKTKSVRGGSRDAY